MTSAHRSDDIQLRESVARQYSELDRRLAANGVARRVHFVNFGYQPLREEPALASALGPLFPNKDSVELLLQLVDGIELSGRAIADIGGGRGGNLDYLARTFGPRTGVVIDLTLASLRHGSTNKRVANTFHVRGDAQHIPLRSRSVDVLLSVESSCHYEDLGAFYSSAYRVLQPRGIFAYTDYLSSEVVDAVPSGLARAGFEVLNWRDISENVIASRLARATRASSVIGADRDDRTADEWTAAPGSQMLASLERGESKYIMCRCTPTRSPVDPVFGEGQRRMIAGHAAGILGRLDFFDRAG